MVTNSVQLKKLIENQKQNLKNHQKTLKARLDQYHSEQKTIFGVNDRIRKLEVKLVATKAAEKRKGIIHPPSSFLGWGLMRRGARFIFGCGDISVDANQLRSFIRLEEAINRHFHADQRMSAHKGAFEFAVNLVRDNGVLGLGKAVMNYTITSSKPREYTFGCGAVVANFNEVYLFQRIHSHIQTHRVDTKLGVLRRSKALSLARKLLKSLTNA